jgi:hypothetical protein
VVSGRAAISEVAGKLLEQFGPNFAFVPEGIAVGHHGFGVLPWHAGPKDGPVVLTGAMSRKSSKARSLASGSC